MRAVTKPTRLSLLLAATALVLTITGCDRLQVGYYLTPANFPTVPPSVTPVPPSTTPATPSETPPSTLRALGTPTLTPLTAPTLTPSPTETLPPCDETEGQMVFGSILSEVTERELHYRVYLPPCYASTARRYPYLIMMHGLGTGMDDSQWDRMGLDEAADIGYARGALPPMIIVMPNGEDGLHAYNPDAYNYSYERQIVEELMPHIESYFCTWNQPSARSIGGLSRGGFWAFEIAFRHPELFDRVGGHSAAFFDDGSPEFNPYFLVDTAVGIERLKMYLDHGASDWTVDNVRYFVERLNRRAIEPEYVVNPVGDHTEDYWAAHTADYLAFYAADWPKDVRELPSCHHPSPAETGDE